MRAVGQCGEQFQVALVVQQHAGTHAVHVVVGVGPVHRSRDSRCAGGVAERQRHHQQGVRVGLLVNGDGVQRGVRHGHHRARVGERSGGQPLVHDGPDDLPLAVPAAEVAGGVRVAHAREGQRGVAVGHMAAGLPFQAGIRVADIAVVAQFNAAERVDHVLESVELDLRHMVDLLPGDLLDLADQGLSVIQLAHGVDLQVVVVDRDQRIPGNGDQRAAAFTGFGQHQNRVGTEPDDIAVAAFTLVGTEHQPRGGGRIGAVRQPGGFDEFAVDPVPHAEQAERRSQYENKQDADDDASDMPAAAWRLRGHGHRGAVGGRRFRGSGVHGGIRHGSRRRGGGCGSLRCSRTRRPRGPTCGFGGRLEALRHLLRRSRGRGGCRGDGGRLGGALARWRNETGRCRVHAGGGRPLATGRRYETGRYARHTSVSLFFGHMSLQCVCLQSFLHGGGIFQRICG